MIFKVLPFVVALAVISGHRVVAQSRESCIGSSCKTYKDINTLWCHSDPTRFCQCRTDASGAWVEQVMPCARNGTYFSFRQQVCVHADRWDRYECLELEPDKEELIDLPEECDNPCRTYEEVSRLWCHPGGAAKRKLYCQCRPTEVERVFQPVPMPCADGTSFSYRKQTCVHDALWADSCP